MKKEQLTPKQLIFFEEYLTDMNATRAALAAGYSKSTALNGQLMAMPKIAAYLDSRMEKIQEKFEVDHDMIHGMIFDELAKIAFANMGSYFDSDGKLKPMDELTDDDKAALHNLKQTDHADGSTTLQINLCNKMTALERLARYTGFYKQKPEVSNTPAKDNKNAEVEKYNLRFDELKRWEEDLEDMDMALDDREELLLKREAELAQRLAALGIELSTAPGQTSDELVEVEEGTEKVVGKLAGQYTPDGYLIKSDEPDDDDERGLYTRLYIEKKMGQSLIVKSYLPSSYFETVGV
jgi:phage terminase small subunit